MNWRRREILQMGGLGALGLSLREVLAADVLLTQLALLSSGFG